VLVTQNGVPFFQPDELVESVRALHGLFADAGCYLGVVPTYVGGFMAFGWATDDVALRDVPVEVLAGRAAAAGLESPGRTRYWTPEVQRASFALPRFIRDLVDAARSS
jgi:spermidine synthase